MRSPILPLTTLVLVGFGVCYGAGVKADIIGNIVVTKADAGHKGWEVDVSADANYTIHGDGTFIMINGGKKIAATNTKGDGTKSVTVSWTTAIAKDDGLFSAVAGKVANFKTAVKYTPKFTDPTSVPDLGWEEDSSGNLSLLNVFTSDVQFTNLAFDVEASGVLTFDEIENFVLGTGPGVSGDVPAGGSLFVGSFSPSAALIARFDASFVDSSFSPVTARDGLYSAFAVIPETSTWVMMGIGFAALGFAAYRHKRYDARRIAA